MNNYLLLSLKRKAKSIGEKYISKADAKAIQQIKGVVRQGFTETLDLKVVVGYLGGKFIPKKAANAIRSYATIRANPQSPEKSGLESMLDNYLQTPVNSISSPVSYSPLEDGLGYDPEAKGSDPNLYSPQTVANYSAQSLSFTPTPLSAMYNTNQAPISVSSAYSNVPGQKDYDPANQSIMKGLLPWIQESVYRTLEALSNYLGSSKKMIPAYNFGNGYGMNEMKGSANGKKPYLAKASARLYK